MIILAVILILLLSDHFRLLMMLLIKGLLTVVGTLAVPLFAFVLYKIFRR